MRAVSLITTRIGREMARPYSMSSERLSIISRRAARTTWTTLPLPATSATDKRATVRSTNGGRVQRTNSLEYPADGVANPRTARQICTCRSAILKPRIGFTGIGSDLAPSRTRRGRATGISAPADMSRTALRSTRGRERVFRRDRPVLLACAALRSGSNPRSVYGEQSPNSALLSSGATRPDPISVRAEHLRVHCTG